MAETYILVVRVRPKVCEEPRGYRGHVGLGATLDLREARDVLVVGVKRPDVRLKIGLSGCIDVVKIHARELGRGLGGVEVDRPA